MAEFTIQIAGKNARVHSLFDSTRDYCRSYLTEETPECTITVTREDLVFEQEAAIAEAKEEGLRIRIFPDPFLERTAIQRKLAEYLFDRDILLVHGNTVAVDGQAYLFTAKCGTGKSTHTRLWRQAFGERAVMVNDDKPFLRFTGQGVLACGSPWSGKHGLDTNITVPLKGICLLERGPEPMIRRAQPRELLPMLLHQTYCPPSCRRQHAALVTALADTVPLWQMACTREIQSALTAWETMTNP